MPTFYIISGCNGAGKTTASYAIFPEMLDCKEFVNMDEIAKALSPFAPETQSIAAGRIVVNRITDLLKQGVTFAVETTLASRSYASIIRKAKAAGYHVSLVFFWLRTPEMAIRRVEQRVRQGGHHVPDDVVIRRYWVGIKNLFNIYLPITDYWILIDNTTDPFEIIAEGNQNKVNSIECEVRFEYLRYQAND